ncbi:MAG: PPC domain-containing protein [Myxococcota bacterium]
MRRAVCVWLVAGGCAGPGPSGPSGSGASTTSSTEFPTTVPWTQDTTAPTDPGPETEIDPSVTVSGRMHYLERVGDEVLCEFDVTFSGPRYTGDCPDCAFAFDIDTTAAVDVAEQGCWSPVSKRLIEDEQYKNLKLAWVDAFDAPYGYVYTDTIAVGASVDLTSQGYGYYPDLAWYPVASAGYGDPTFDGGSITAGFSDTYDYTYFIDWNECDTYADEFPGSLLPGGIEVELPCDGSLTQVFTFDATEGDALTISVDTVAVETASENLLLLNGPDGCTVMYAYDSVECTVPPSFGGCPAFTITAPQTGTYTAMVSPFSSYPPYFYNCSGDTAAFRFAAVGGSAPALGPVQPTVGSTTKHTEMTFDATIEGEL